MLDLLSQHLPKGEERECTVCNVSEHLNELFVRELMRDAVGVVAVCCSIYWTKVSRQAY